MKKRIFKIIAVMLSAVLLAGCTFGWKESDQVTDEILDEEDEDSGAGQISNPGEETVVALSDDLKAAVCNALISQYGTDYSDAGYVIPVFCILEVNNETPDNIMIWGDFWRFAYKLEGDTLISAAGEDVSGCMHLQEQNGTYQCIGLDVPEAGSNGVETTIQDIFGSCYDSLLQLRSDYERQEQNRAQLIADYVAAYGIPAVKYTDQNWEPAELPVPSPDEDNIFIYMLQAAEPEAAAEVQEIEAQPEEETIQVQEEPATDSYTVKHGDTLGSIARKYGISTAELAEMNRDIILQDARRQGVRSGDLMKCANYIYPGEVLTVPVN